jgi:predicted DCC family thiol-disulfide oxidoreductase YuxK
VGFSGRLFILALLGGAAIALFVKRRSVLRVIRTFFTEEGGPFNLAVFRIVFFGAFALFFLPPLGEVKHYAAIPKTLQTPPWLLGHLLASLPLNATWVTASYVLLVVGCALAALGVFTRVAAAVVVISGFYYLGIEQLYGKVDHGHHLLWIAVIFALSRSADALSVSSLVRAWRSPRPGAEPVRSRAYTLPLRFIWLLMACCYFFPGIQKLRYDSWHWLQPATLNVFLHLIWFQNGNYRPPIISRPDHLPMFIFLGALGTLMFETAWVTLIFTRTSRFIAAGAQIVFHNLTNALMLIPFWVLQVCAISLIDWEWLSEKAFRRRGQLMLVYDGGCGICGRTVTAIRAFALPSGVSYVNALDEASVNAAGVRIDHARLLEDMYVFAPDGRAYAGYDAYRRLAWRVPILWPAIPILALPPVAGLGRRVYRHVAQGRACSAERLSVVPMPRLRVRAVTFGGAALLGVIVLIGLYGTMKNSNLQKTANGWPIATYPAFTGYGGNDTTSELSLAGVIQDGRVQPISLATKLSFMQWERRAGFVSSLLARRGATTQRTLSALIGYLRPVSASGRPFAAIRVYREVVSTRPEDPGRLLRRAMVLGQSEFAQRRVAGRQYAGHAAPTHATLMADR